MEKGASLVLPFAAKASRAVFGVGDGACGVVAAGGRDLEAVEENDEAALAEGELVADQIGERRRVVAAPDLGLHEAVWNVGVHSAGRAERRAAAVAEEGARVLHEPRALAAMTVEGTVLAELDADVAGDEGLRHRGEAVSLKPTRSARGANARGGLGFHVVV